MASVGNKFSRSSLSDVGTVNALVMPFGKSKMDTRHACAIRPPPGLSLNDGEPSLPGMKSYLHAPDAVVRYFFERATVDDVTEAANRIRTPSEPSNVIVLSRTMGAR